MKAARVILRREAERDIEGAIGHYLAEAGTKVALSFVDELESAFEQLIDNPAMGSPRYAVELDLPGLRFWSLNRFPYLIFYVEREAGLDVWRVLHGQRDIPPSLQSSG